MPKSVPEDQKIYKCEFCDKRYAYLSGKIAHQKSKHNEQRVNLKIKQSLSLLENTSNVIDTSKHLKKIQKQFLDGEISASEYEKLNVQLAKIKNTQNQSKHTDLSIDLGRFLENDQEYIREKLSERFNEGLAEIEEQIIQGNIVTTFNRIFVGQFRIFEGQFEIMHIEYLDGSKIVDKELTPKMFAKLMNSIISALCYKYRYTENDEEIIINEQEEDSLRYRTAIDKVYRMNNLAQRQIMKDTVASFYNSIMLDRIKYFSLPLNASFVDSDED